MSRHYFRHSGMTLLELLTGIALLSIVLTAAVSGFSTLFANARINSQVNALVHSVHLAKQISRAKGTEITLCGSRNGVQCDVAKNWSDGWLIFANLDKDSPAQTDPNETLLEVHKAGKAVNISANRQAFVLRPFGKRSTNGTLIYCDQRGSASARSIILSYTGKPRVSNKTADGQPLTCPSVS